LAQGESDILKRVMLAAGSAGLRLFRNHNGLFYDKDGRAHKTGLCKGSSDLVGWHIGTGKFVAAEIKTKTGVVSVEQQNFLDQVNKAGGIGIVCRDEKDLKKLIDNALKCK
jgi:hypothetical protein